MSPEPIKIKAPAKLNLFLKVLGHRDDGFHEIDSIVQILDWGDDLEFFPAPGAIALEVEGQAPSGPENLVWKTAELMRKKFKVKAGVRIRLRKEIPPLMGLGGGSSDAAAALMGLNKLWNLNLGFPEIRVLGAELGSDVPLFLSQSAAVRIHGRGETVAPVPTKLQGWAVIVCPMLISVATPWAYGALKHPHDRRGSGSGDRMEKALASGAWDLLKQCRFNEFETAVFPVYPQLKLWRQRLIRAGSFAAGMTGSGAALFGLVPAREQALEIMDKIIKFPEAKIILAGFGSSNTGFNTIPARELLPKNSGPKRKG